MMIQVMTVKQKGEAKGNPNTKREITTLHQILTRTIMIERELITIKNLPPIHTITKSITEKYLLNNNIMVHGLSCIVGLGFSY